VTQPAVHEEAREVLARMATIVKNEMLVHNEYVTDRVERPDLAETGAVCGGRRACAVGALYLAAGVRPRRMEYGASLPGVLPENRRAFLRRRPALKLAYDELNAAAGRYAARNGIEHGEGREFAYGDSGLLEQLFEHGLPEKWNPNRKWHESATPAERKALLSVIRGARRALAAKPTQETRGR
jgi:hypothetical protein